MQITLAQLAEHLGAELIGGDPATTVERLASLSDAGEGSLSFLANPKYADQLATTKATAVIAGKDCAAAPVAVAPVITCNPCAGL